MNKIDERKQAFENKFVHDAEQEFKINARAHKMIGIWAATQMKMDQKSIDSYATKLLEDSVYSSYNEDQLAAKLAKDFAEASIKSDLNEIKSSILRIKKEAQEYIKNLKI